MQTLLTKALVASATVAGLGLLAAPQASAVVTGSLSFSGNLSNTLPADSATITSTDVDTATGDFAGTTDYIFTPLTFNFTEVASPAFTSNPFTITTVGGGAAGTVVSFGSGSFTKVGTTAFFPTAELVGVDGDGTKYLGLISFNQSGNAASYSGSFTAVPEPLTMLGASAAIAFGAAFKRRNANKG